MQKTTILFVCPDNSLLGPLAEAYLNARGGGLARAFSAGIAPHQGLNPSVRKLLAAQNIDAEGLEPKSVDVFLMPLAPRPDEIIFLAEMDRPELPPEWSGVVGVHEWTVAGRTPYPESMAAAEEYFRRIRQAVDKALAPQLPTASASASAAAA